QCRRDDLHRAELPDSRSDGRIAKHRCSRHAGRDLLEQLQPFPAHAEFVDGEPGRVAARMCQARDETGADRIDDIHEYDRNGFRRLQQRRYGCGAGRSQEDVGCERDQFCRVSVNIAGIGPAGFGPQVAALAPSQLAERLCERREPGLITSSARPISGSGTEMPNALAVFRLMMSSSFVACWTASSAAFSPFRIRTVY